MGREVLCACPRVASAAPAASFKSVTRQLDQNFSFQKSLSQIIQDRFRRLCLLLKIPILMWRYFSALETCRDFPLIAASRAESPSIKCVPLMATFAAPTVFRTGPPNAFRATDTRYLGAEHRSGSSGKRRSPGRLLRVHRQTMIARHLSFRARDTFGDVQFFSISRKCQAAFKKQRHAAHLPFRVLDQCIAVPFVRAPMFQAPLVIGAVFYKPLSSLATRPPRPASV